MLVIVVPTISSSTSCCNSRQGGLILCKAITRSLLLWVSLQKRILFMGFESPLLFIFVIFILFRKEIYKKIYDSSHVTIQIFYFLYIFIILKKTNIIFFKFLSVLNFFPNLTILKIFFFFNR